MLETHNNNTISLHCLHGIFHNNIFMAAKLILDKRSIKKNGSYPVKISVHLKTTILISTGVEAREDQWLDGTIVNHPQKKALNSTLSFLLTRTTNRLYELSVLGKLSNLTTAQIKEVLKNPVSGEGEQEAAQIYTFEMGYQAHICTLNKKSTVGVFEQTKKRLIRYVGEKGYYEMTFDMMNKRWIMGFDAWMAKNNLRPNTRSIDLRNVRTIFNAAINSENIPIGMYPFKGFKIPKEKTVKRSLSIEQFVRLRDANLQGSHLEKYRDFFLLSFYLCGINPIDVLFLRHEDIRHGRIEKLREKTGQPISLEIPPEAMVIFEKYKGENYALSVMDRYGDYLNFVRRTAKALKLIEDKEGRVIEPKISIYWARHSWATIATNLDIPDKTVSAALTHADNSVTGIYVNFDSRKIGMANRKVIDYLNNYQLKE